MRARLFSHASALRVDHEFTEEATVGRGTSNSLSLQSRLLSGFHARISWDDELGCYRLQDMGSTNGTRLDGRRIKDALLGHLHVVTLADKLDIVFQDLERCAARQKAHHEARREAQRAGAKPASSVQDAIPPSEKTQHTSIQSLALALPELLRAPGAQPATPAASSRDGRGQDGHVSDGTMLERLPLPLPSFLRSPQESAGATQAGPSAAGKPATDSDLRATEPPPGELAEGSPGAGRPQEEPPSTDPPAGELAEGDAAMPQPASSVIPSALRATSEVPPTRDWSGTYKDPSTGFFAGKLPPGQEDVFFLAAHTAAGKTHYELREGVNLIGRSMDAEVRIDSPEVSRRHANLTLKDGRLTLRDLGSRNRTFVNGEPLTKEPVNIMPGQRLRFGALEVVIGVSAAKVP